MQTLRDFFKKPLPITALLFFVFVSIIFPMKIADELCVFFGRGDSCILGFLEGLVLALPLIMALIVLITYRIKHTRNDRNRINENRKIFLSSLLLFVVPLAVAFLFQWTLILIPLLGAFLFLVGYILFVPKRSFSFKMCVRFFVYPLLLFVFLIFLQNFDSFI